MAEQSFKVGDSVRVKAEIRDVDLGTEISGWQGRIKEISPKDDVITVKWDSIALRNTPSEVITKCEQEGLDWTEYRIGLDEVDPSTARDTEDDVEEAIDEIESAHAWDYIDGPEGELIRQVFAEYEDDVEDEMDALYAWDEYLTANLTLPFDAKVSEFQERGPFRVGDKVKVVELDDTDNLYGIIVRLGSNRKGSHFPLCDLEAVDKKSSQYLPVHAYSVWFANR
ncbi:calcium-binding protein [Chloroflexi bacterium TSY]|nr:calcium-binding protein [Chloroflexi bacterium TSY]